MDKHRTEGKWDQVKGEAKEQWGKLTDNESMELEGRKDQFKGDVKEGYGNAKESVSEKINDFFEDDEYTRRRH